jgi:hypothetical protein
LREPEAAGPRRIPWARSVQTLGFFPVDLGLLKVGGVQTTPLGPLSMINFAKV